MAKKVLLVDQFRDMGGAQCTLLKIIETALRADLQITVLFPRQGSFEAAIQSKFNGKVRCVALWQPRMSFGKKTVLDWLKMTVYIVYFFKFFKLFLKQDLIYCNGGRVFVPAAVLSVFARRSVIYHLHLDHSSIEKKMISVIARLSTTYKILATSRFVLEKLKSSLKEFPWQKFSVVESVLLFDNRLPFENRFSEQPLRLRAAIFGRVSAEKGQDIVLKLAPAFLNLDIHIVGDCDFQERDFLDNLKAASPKENVFFHGRVFNLDQWVQEQQIHFSIVPSRWEEPFGLVAIESMARSCLTLLRGRGGLVEIASKTGALSFAEDGDLLALMHQLTQRSMEDLAAMAYRQYQLVWNHYNAKRFETQIEELLREA